MANRSQRLCEDSALPERTGVPAHSCVEGLKWEIVSLLALPAGTPAESPQSPDASLARET